MTEPDNTLRSDLLALASSLATAAGNAARDGRAEHGITSIHTKTTSTDVVTEFDKASEQLIVEGIRTARPDDGIVAEEGTNVAGTSGIEWLIDPLDGTTNFVYGLPGWAVSIAAVSAHGSEVGAVYVPATAELFTATRGGGAFLNGRSLQCSALTDVSVALIATGFSYQVERRRRQAARIAALLPRVRDVRRFGAAAPDLCYVAAGRVDAYYEEWLAPWDLAAGGLIAREAGCRTGSLDGTHTGTGSVLASNPMLYQSLLALIGEIDEINGI